MKDKTVIAAHFERHLGRAKLVRRDSREALVPRHVYGAPPCEGRAHWVLHTLGAGILTLEGHDGADRYAEFVMSLPVDWIPSEQWPAYMFQRASHAILNVGKAPDEGGVFFNSAESVPGSPHVFALLVAHARQLGKHAQFRVPSGRLIDIYAMYPLTYDAWLSHQKHQLDITSLPEVVVHWQDMLR